MALNRRALQKLINNPGMFSPEDMELGEEDIQDDLDQTIESPIEEPEMMGAEDMAPEEMVEPEIEEPELAGEELAVADEDGLGELLTTLRDEVNVKHDANAKAFIGNEELPESPETAKLRRLKSGESLDEQEDLSDQDASEIAKDMEAPVDLRKRALQKIKQRYLGK